MVSSRDIHFVIFVRNYAWSVMRNVRISHYVERDLG